MLRKLLIVAIIPLITPVILFAQTTFTTSNAYVRADVTSNLGLGRIRIWAGSNQQRTLTSADYTCFLTVNVNNNFYTNNLNISLGGYPQYPKSYLENGITVYTGPTKDTIETVWQPEGATKFDIVQDVYSVAFPLTGSGQIVYKFSVRNHTNQTVTAQAQYLLDVDISSPTQPAQSGDNAPITTRYGYVTDWTKFPDSINQIGMPPYFIATLDSIGNNSFPGWDGTGGVGVGYNNDSLAPEPMGLMQPQQFALVDWSIIAQNWTWGFPTAHASRVIDDALLIQWPLVGIDSGNTIVVGCGSYGTPACTPFFTFENLDALMLHPDHIVWNGSEYVPNTFPVEAVVWDPMTGQSTDTAYQSVLNSLTGTVTPSPIQIIAPLQVPKFGRGTKATSFSWKDTVIQNVLTDCKSDSSYNILANINKALTGPYITCSCPITVDCQGKSYVVPQTTVLSRTGSYDGSECNMRSTDVVTFDTGLEKIPVVSVTVQSDTNMKLTIAPSHPGADSMYYTVSVIDSMQNGSATIKVMDSLGNIAFERYEYCTISDRKAPLIRPGDCKQGLCVNIADDRLWDRGIDTIIVTSVSNMIPSFTPPFNWRAASSILLTALSTDRSLPSSLCIEAIDLGGNKFDTCFSFGSSFVSGSSQPLFALSISPNPTSVDATFFIEGALSASVEIFDVLGREVDHFIMSDKYDWQTSGLPAGTYIVRANENGPSGEAQSVTKRIIKE